MNSVWLLVVIGGVLGYALAARAKRVFGVSPWRLPPIVWGIVCAFVPVLGIVLETVAQLTTRHALPPGVDPRGPGVRSPFHPGPPSSEAHRPGPNAGPARSWWPSATPGQTDVPTAPPSNIPLLEEAQPGERRLPGPGGWRPAEAGQVAGETPPLFGWYADPTGRHELRYWDGRHWWDSVSDSGSRSEDPIGA